jgi:hypothetical protein
MSKDSKSKNKNKSSKEGRQGGVSTPLPAIRLMVAGIDIGSTEHWVCGPARADGERNVRVFGTTTAQLQELAQWLAEQGVES